MSDHLLGFHYRFVAGEGKDTLLLLHGTGGDESDLLQLGRALWPAANLLGVRGRVLEHGMPRFFRRLGPGVFDEADLTQRTHELADFIRAAADLHRLDSERIDAVGYSNGANIAASLLLLEPGVLRRAVLFRAMLPLQPKTVPDLHGTAAFVAAGRGDPQIPAEGTQALVELLSASGAEVTVHWVDGGHGLSQEELPPVRAWLAGSGMK
ncbi:MAG: alpha/beta hydrolase [Thermaerobacter sp.]|nr:alpha/beta hydrolase [Thermaerobacter sp.]